ncbi:hypothetical protein [Streptomyces nitrosporeus]|uniref:hypothetical protein n=1 Tax=Streptomyces nitrosporeus TaxID=28894 RepID=UPI001983FE27|nr:hypothetical protein [Streptomyces nitrosporeus]GGZ19559.1 hypothetical protein GCM10010327_58320 [Streptomyces nitrosporeus]
MQFVAAWPLGPSADAADVAAVDARVRTAIDRKVAADWAEFLEITDPADLENNQARADLAAALTAHGTVQQIAGETERTALAVFGRTEEAEAEADQAYRTEQGRRWFRHNPNSEAAVTAATKASTAARTRAAQHLLTVRLEQLREQAAARTEQVAPAPWTDRLPELAARQLDADTSGAVMA